MIDYCRQILISNAGFILLCQIFDLEALIELFFVLILFWAVILYMWHYGKLIFHLQSIHLIIEQSKI